MPGSPAEQRPLALSVSSNPRRACRLPARREIATGELPKRGQLREPLVPVECPAEALALVHRCCARDPEARPTAVEVVQLLQKAPATPQSSLCSQSGASMQSAGDSRIFAPPSAGGSSTHSGGPNSGEEPWLGCRVAAQQAGGAAASDGPPQLSSVQEDSSEALPAVSPLAAAGALPAVSPFAAAALQQAADAAGGQAQQQAPALVQQQSRHSGGQQQQAESFPTVELRRPRAVRAPASPFVSPFAQPGPAAAGYPAQPPAPQ